MASIEVTLGGFSRQILLRPAWTVVGRADVTEATAGLAAIGTTPVEVPCNDYISLHNPPTVGPSRLQFLEVYVTVQPTVEVRVRRDAHWYDIALLVSSVWVLV